jgi:hypothetical protein
MRLFTTAGIVVCAAWPGCALAGMPHFTLADVVRLRLSGISFFAVALLLCAFGVKALWNYLRRDFPRMPQIGYGRSLALVLLLGLLFNIVLLMIAGTRELMTPGAWEKSDISYRLRDQAPPKAVTPGNQEKK